VRTRPANQWWRRRCGSLGRAGCPWRAPSLDETLRRTGGCEGWEATGSMQKAPITLCRKRATRAEALDRRVVVQQRLRVPPRPIGRAEGRGKASKTMTFLVTRAIRNVACSTGGGLLPNKGEQQCADLSRRSFTALQGALGPCLKAAD
jgi:hypothetical protein